MTKIVALSDTHLRDSLPEALTAVLEGADMLLHAGDFVTMDVYESMANLGRLEAVCGNADSDELKDLLPERKIIEIEGIKIGLIHQASHCEDTIGAWLLAKEMEVDMLVFGHIHRPVVERREKLLICPGSPTVPRMSPPSVAEIEIQEGEVRGRIVPIGKPICDYLKFAEVLAERNHDLPGS